MMNIILVHATLFALAIVFVHVMPLKFVHAIARVVDILIGIQINNILKLS